MAEARHRFSNLEENHIFFKLFERAYADLVDTLSVPSHMLGNQEPRLPMDKQIILPGLTEDETRYFQWLLCQNFKQIDEQKWKDLGKLNQKILAAMYKEN